MSSTEGSGDEANANHTEEGTPTTAPAHPSAGKQSATQVTWRCCREKKESGSDQLGAGVVGAGTRQHGQHGQHGRPRRHPAALAEPARTRRARPRSRHRGVGGGGGWRRLAAAAQPAATSCGQAQKASSPPASASSHPLAVAWPPRVWAARTEPGAPGSRALDAVGVCARHALALSCRCTLWRHWCNAPGQWARRAAGAPLATRCASCSGAVDAAGGGESTAGGLAWPPFACWPGTSADLAGCSLDQQRVGSARCAVRRPTAHLLGGPGVGRVRCAQRSREGLPHRVATDGRTHRCREGS